MFTYILLLLLYLVPVVFIQGLLDPARWVREEWIGLKHIADTPLLFSLVTGFVPGLAMVLFLWLLTPILRAMEARASHLSVGALELEVLTKLFWFQYVTVFIFSLGVSSVAQGFEAILADPTTFVAQLAHNIPAAEGFFLSYLLTRAFAENLGLLLDAFSASKYVFQDRLAPTPRARALLWTHITYDYGARIPVVAITCLLALVYANSPMVPAVATIFALSARLESSYRLIMMATPAYQTAGRMWPAFLSSLMAGLVSRQVLLVAMLGLKWAPGPAVLTLVPLFGACCFWRSLRNRVSRPLAATSLFAARDLDAFRTMYHPHDHDHHGHGHGHGNGHDGPGSREEEDIGDIGPVVGPVWHPMLARGGGAVDGGLEKKTVTTVERVDVLRNECYHVLDQLDLYDRADEEGRARIGAEMRAVGVRAEEGRLA